MGGDDDEDRRNVFGDLHMTPSQFCRLDPAELTINCHDRWSLELTVDTFSLAIPQRYACLQQTSVCSPSDSIINYDIFSSPTHNFSI